MLGRFLIAYPPHTCVKWTEEVPPCLDLGPVIDKLYGLKLGADNQAVELTLHPEAMQVWERYFNENQKMVEESEGPLSYAIAKHFQHCLRFANLIHCYVAVEEGQPNNSCVYDKSMTAAVQLTKWFQNETERIYHLFEMTNETRDLESLVFKIAKRGGSISVRDLQRTNSKKYKNADSARLDLEQLETQKVGVFVSKTEFSLDRNNIEPEPEEPPEMEWKRRELEEWLNS